MTFNAFCFTRALPARSVWLLWLVGALIFPSEARSQNSSPELVLLEVRLDQTQLSEAVPAYRQGQHTLLPLGELSSLLTIAIQTRPADGTASGYVLTEARGFHLDVNAGTVTQSGVTKNFDPSLIMNDSDDLYIAETLLEQWLPLDLAVDYSRLTLTVDALEELPLQSRLARAQQGERAQREERHGPDNPLHPLKYRMLGMPAIDQTLTLERQHSEDNEATDARYSAVLTGDLLHLESQIYVHADTRDSASDVRITLGRHDPNAGLLGPLGARSYQFGSISGPSVNHVTAANTSVGVAVSNAPLTQPNQFDSQTFEGELSPGWDVELYYNDALIGYQQVGVNGRYRFEDQPLSYGRNDFRLVFNGPLGQTRVEHQSFSLANSMVRPGEFQYSVSGQESSHGSPRAAAQVKVGLTRSLTGSLELVRDPMQGEDEVYLLTGLRSYWRAVSFGGEYVRSQSGGSLLELSAQTRIGAVSISGSRLYSDDFVSNQFPKSGDPVRTRDSIRMITTLPLSERTRLPFALAATQDTSASGSVRTNVTARISANVYDSTLTKSVNWQATDAATQTTGSLQFSRRIGATSLRGRADYVMDVDPNITSLGVSANRPLSDGYQVTAGIDHSFSSLATSYTAGFNKDLGAYGLGLNAKLQDSGSFTIGARLFTASVRNPHRSDWVFDSRSMAHSGTVSIRLFIDDNGNDVMDPEEQPLEGAGFIVDNVRHSARTDASGIAHIDQLPVKQYVNIQIDETTLIDPQWLPATEGWTLLPRPGRVARIDLPLQVTTEIDGTVYLLSDNSTRAIAGIQLELQDANNETVARGVSGWDGFYIIPKVVAGEYWLRINPDQLTRLGLTDTGTRKLTVTADGAFISGVDITLLPTSRSESHQAEPSQAIPEMSEFRTEAWISQQNAAHYTIQLVAAASESGVQHYIRRHGLMDTSAYFYTVRHGSPWYSVIFGQFSTYDEAQTALTELPSSITGASPWLRQFSEIQKRIAVESSVVE